MITQNRELKNAVLDDKELQAGLKTINPKFGDFVTRVAGEVWGLPLIDQKTKALITIAIDVANQSLKGPGNPFGAHVDMALKQGATREEIEELLLFLCVYTGFNKVASGFGALNEFFAQTSNGKANQSNAQVTQPTANNGTTHQLQEDGKPLMLQQQLNAAKANGKNGSQNGQKVTNKRKSYYQELAADYSRPGLVSSYVAKKLIEDGEKFVAMKEKTLPTIGPDYTIEQIEQENKEWWPTHCEALRQGRGDILTGEYREDLVYLCQDGPYQGLEQQKEREQHWWALIAQPGVTMCWPIVMFHGDVTYFEWKCVDDETNETLAKGNVTWMRRGHRGGCYLKTEQLTFYRDVFAPNELLKLITT